MSTNLHFISTTYIKNIVHIINVSFSIEIDLQMLTVSRVCKSRLLVIFNLQIIVHLEQATVRICEYTEEHTVKWIAALV